MIKQSIKKTSKYRLLEITCAKLKVNQFQMFGTEPALEWLNVAKHINESSKFFTFAISLNNRLYVLLEEDQNIEPIRFVINGVVGRLFGGKPTIQIHYFESSLGCINFLLLSGKLAYEMYVQLSLQYGSSLEMYNSFTGASIRFDTSSTEIRWNDSGYLSALSPLSNYLLKDLDIKEENLSEYDPVLETLICGF